MENVKQIKKTIGNRLKAIRLEKDLTLDQIAQAAGIAAPTVYRIENNLSEPNERTIHKLQKAFPELVDAA